MVTKIGTYDKVGDPYNHAKFHHKAISRHPSPPQGFRRRRTVGLCGYTRTRGLPVPVPAGMGTGSNFTGTGRGYGSGTGTVVRVG